MSIQRICVANIALLLSVTKDNQSQWKHSQLIKLNNMTDKVQKIREEVERMHNLLPVMDGDNISVNYADRICTTLEMYIDSLQKEPVSEDLEQAAVEAFKQIVDSDKNNFLEIFKGGAKWQTEQFEKNRLAACDRQAEEEAEIESDFVMGIIESEHRQPTFDDAIKYGMRLQKERLLAKVVDGEDSLTLDGVITFDYYDGDKAYGCVAHDSFCLEDRGLKDMDKVKILILKKY